MSCKQPLSNTVWTYFSLGELVAKEGEVLIFWKPGVSLLSVPVVGPVNLYSCIPLSPQISPLSSPVEQISTGGAPRSLSLLHTAGNICFWKGDKKGLATPPCHVPHNIRARLLPAPTDHYQTQPQNHGTSAFSISVGLSDDSGIQTWLNICLDIIMHYESLLSVWAAFAVSCSWDVRTVQFDQLCFTYFCFCTFKIEME